MGHLLGQIHLCLFTKMVVDVYITLEISQLDEFFGAEVLAVVGPEVRTGLGEDERLAETQALKSAANDAIDSLINRL